MIHITFLVWFKKLCKNSNIWDIFIIQRLSTRESISLDIIMDLSTIRPTLLPYFFDAVALKPKCRAHPILFAFWDFVFGGNLFPLGYNIDRIFENRICLIYSNMSLLRLFILFHFLRTKIIFLFGISAMWTKMRLQ